MSYGRGKSLGLRAGSGLRLWAFLAMVSALGLTGLGSAGVEKGALTQKESAWPGFGGPGGNFLVQSVNFAESWPADGPPSLWSRQIGPGYSQVSATATTVFAFFRDGDDDVVVALDQVSGKQRWEHRYGAPAREGHQVEFGTGPHATPLVLEDRLITLGYAGELRALDLGSGSLLWRRHLLDELGGAITPWGFSASPIGYDGLVLVPMGGAAGIVAVAPSDGKVVWKSAATTVSYASPQVVNVQRQDQLLYFAADALHAIDPLKEGAPLWNVEIRNGFDNHASTPVWNGEDLLWVVSQLESGARALRLDRQGGKATVETVWKNRRVRVHHWNTLRIDDVVYGAIGDGVQILSAVDLATGKILWKDRSFGLSNLVQTPEGTILLTEKGDLALIRLSRKGLEVKAQAELGEGTYWTAPTLIGSRLFVRDGKTLRAFELGKKAEASVLPGAVEGAQKSEVSARTDEH